MHLPIQLVPPQVRKSTVYTTDFKISLLEKMWFHLQNPLFVFHITDKLEYKCVIRKMLTDNLHYINLVLTFKDHQDGFVFNSLSFSKTLSFKHCRSFLLLHVMHADKNCVKTLFTWLRVIFSHFITMCFMFDKLLVNLGLWMYHKNRSKDSIHSLRIYCQRTYLISLTTNNTIQDSWELLYCI